MGLSKPINANVVDHNTLAGRGVSAAHPIGSITDLESTLSGLSTGVDSASTAATGAAADVATLETTVSTGFTNTNNAVAGLDTRLDTAEADIVAIEGSIPPDVSARMTTAESDIDTLQSSMSTAQADIAVLQSGGSADKTDSYLMFIANINATMLDAAFGKDNVTAMTELGRQLALYSWYKGDNPATFTYTNLITKNTLAECFEYDSLAELLFSTHLTTLIAASPFATGLYNAIDSVSIGKAVAQIAGLVPGDYADMTAVANSSAAMTAVANSANAMGIVTTNNICMTAVCASAVALNKIVQNNIAKTALLTNIVASDWYARSATIKATLIAGTTYFTAANADGTMSVGSGGSTDYIGGATSFGYVDTLTDADGGTPNFSDVKHQHNNLSFGSSIGVDISSTIQRHGIGGAIITSSGDSGTLTYTASTYTAI